MTPGVYVEEVSTLPPSVAEVSTAVPAFIGYTEKGPSLAQVSTMLEYEQLFGGPKLASFTVTVDASSQVTGVTRGPGPGFLLYYAVSHYFKNGGGKCYIVSAGDYSSPPAKDKLAAGLSMLEKEDEPTLVVLTDAVSLEAADYHELCQAALAQCARLGDRFAIFDVKKDAASGKKDIDVFRDGIGTSHLAYGAAYYPYLQTSLSYAYADPDVTIQDGAAAGVALDTLKASRTAIYQQVKARLSAERVVLPPSAAVAGIYASVDRDRGVWKAPANVSVAAVIGPVLKITSEAQDALNVDPTAGKSINAVRAFTGKGTIVWGARTLAGNDNEWRYISVRRLFIMIEESARKATSFAVFEPNDMTTWLKVKGMIESFLYGLWERGALAGASPAAAYFVNVGLGKTMTNQDVLEGRMIVEIGIAAVRPAEFVVLRFSHKMQEA
ncbi:phage tail sheath C-terminal domain-containing protein [Sorangium sp. So ce185]|uniref:phage tail sheath family protein n=1 Tax=Sorangium sp. So ce185 TaxID=3133287 RepID=UPI003F62BEA8